MPLRPPSAERLPRKRSGAPSGAQVAVRRGAHMEGHHRRSASPSGFGPRRLAEVATRHPGRVLAGWGVVVLVSLGLIGALLGSALTSDSSLTNHPDSVAAQDL